jgi:hypothetical protein
MSMVLLAIGLVYNIIMQLGEIGCKDRDWIYLALNRD